MLTVNQQNEILKGFRRGNEALLRIVAAKGVHDQWLAGACLAARARYRVVLAALAAIGFFDEWIPVWLQKAHDAEIVGNHARRSYYLCLANAGRDARSDALRSARGWDMPKTIVFDMRGRVDTVESC